MELGTKIKREFIEAIEASDWVALPDFPVVAGFVRNLAAYLEVDPKLAQAVLKRDYPPKKLPINPKPDVENKFTWTPRYTFWVGILTVMIAIFGYLGFQYYKFNSPPTLTIYQPIEGSVISSNQVIVNGKTDPNATIKVNNQAVLVADDGKFQTTIEIFSGTKEIDVIATSRSGKQATLKRGIVVKIK